MGCDIHMFIEKRAGKDAPWEAATVRMPCGWCPAPGSDLEKRLVEKKCYGCGGDKFQKTYDHRNYNAFAVLANVRNGTGFAGVLTGDSFLPISDPRGLPADLSPRLRSLFREARDEESRLLLPDGSAPPLPEGDHWEKAYERDKAELGCGYSGDHSFSHLTLRELLADDAYWDREHVHVGIVGFSEVLSMVAEGRDEPQSWCGSVSGGSVRHYEAEFLFKAAQYLLAKTRGGASREELLAGAPDDRTREFFEQPVGNDGSDSLALALRAEKKDRVHFFDRAYCEIAWVKKYKESVGALYSEFIPALVELCEETEGAGPEDVRIVFGFDS